MAIKPPSTEPPPKRTASPQRRPRNTTNNSAMKVEKVLKLPKKPVPRSNRSREAEGPQL